MVRNAGGDREATYAVTIDGRSSGDRIVLRATAPRQAALLAAALCAGENRSDLAREMRAIEEVAELLPKHAWDTGETP